MGVSDGSHLLLGAIGLPIVGAPMAFFPEEFVDYCFGLQVKALSRYPRWTFFVDPVKHQKWRHLNVRTLRVIGFVALAVGALDWAVFIVVKFFA